MLSSRLGNTLFPIWDADLPDLGMPCSRRGNYLGVIEVKEVINYPLFIINFAFIAKKSLISHIIAGNAFVQRASGM